jgi:hypothetical protein
MYGLPQAGKLAHDLLQECLVKHGYAPIPNTTCLWTHTTRPITFTLVVNDFGVKYIGKENAEHFKTALKENHTVSTDWKGALYCGISLDWDYKQRTVQNSMPNYIQQAIYNLQHATTTRPQPTPYPWRSSTYGTKIELTLPPDNTPLVDKKQITRTQQVLGTQLYWARAVNTTIKLEISALTS